MGGRGIRTTWMQALPGLDRWYRYYVPLYPFAVRTSKTGGYGFVLSSCFGFAKGLRKSSDALHICYCHTPPRWIWRAEDYMSREGWGSVIRLALKGFIGVARRWDLLPPGNPMSSSQTPRRLQNGCTVSTAANLCYASAH